MADKETAAKENEPVVEKASSLDKDYKANRRRVFRVENPPTNESLVVVNRPAKEVDGMKFPPVCKSLQPNMAQQYVLAEDAEFYPDALKSLRFHEGRGFIKEVPLLEEGVPYVPPRQKKIKELEEELAKLKLKL